MDAEKMVLTIRDALSRCLGAHISHVNPPSGFDFTQLEAHLQGFTTKEIPALVKMKENGSEMTDIELMVVALRASISDWNHSSHGKEYLLDTEWLVDHAIYHIDKDIGSTDKAPNVEYSESPSGNNTGVRSSRTIWSQEDMDSLLQLRIQGVPYGKIMRDHFPNCTLKTLQMKVANSKARTAELRQQLQHQKEEDYEEGKYS
ncbi:hypothetical protein VM1G_02218 [Cytospora mali]|uniref:Uncharacterized protein n=1 Tax=Cytospora mali TaxID=578113 RepID=A0A194VRY7_CYTMA|nr:hypothetical protein VM1G_02218 [Valsa mali]